MSSVRCMTTPIATGTPFSGFAVSDIAAARTFYADVLGLAVDEEHGMLRIQLTGDAAVLAYPKADHVPATYTMLNLPVSDIDAAVAELVRRGVSSFGTTGCPRTTTA